MAELADFTRNIVEFCSFLNIKAILLLRNLFLGVIYWQTIFLEKLNHQNLPCRSRWKRKKYFIKASCKLVSVRIMQFALILPAK